MVDTINRTFNGAGIDYDMKITPSFSSSGKVGHKPKHHWLVDLIKRW